MRTIAIVGFILSSSFIKSQTTTINATNEPQTSVLMINGQPFSQTILPNGVYIDTNAVPIIAYRRDTPDTTNTLIITYPDNQKIKAEDQKTNSKNKPK